MSDQPMPLITVKTNIADVQAPDILLKGLSAALATATDSCDADEGAQWKFEVDGLEVVSGGAE